jgi:hypothetical protein
VDAVGCRKQERRDSYGKRRVEIDIGQAPRFITETQSDVVVVLEGRFIERPLLPAGFGRALLAARDRDGQPTLGDVTARVEPRSPRGGLLVRWTEG